MDLNELLNLIDKENVKDIAVKKYSYNHGNRDQSGDYFSIVMCIGKAECVFSNESGTWESDNS